MITTILQNRIDILKSFIKPTTSNKNQFETNVRNEFMVQFFQERLNFIEKQQSYIGKEVFKFKKNISVITMDDYNHDNNLNKHFNPIEENGFIYEQKDFYEFTEKYVQFQIERLTKELVTNTHYSNSTNPFSNLEYHWIIECKQNLIQFLSEIKL